MRGAGGRRYGGAGGCVGRGINIYLRAVSFYCHREEHGAQTFYIIRKNTNASVRKHTRMHSENEEYFLNSLIQLRIYRKSDSLTGLKLRMPCRTASYRSLLYCLP